MEKNTTVGDLWRKTIDENVPTGTPITILVDGEKRIVNLEKSQLEDDGSEFVLVAE